MGLVYEFESLPPPNTPTCNQPPSAIDQLSRLIYWRLWPGGRDAPKSDSDLTHLYISPPFSLSCFITHFFIWSICLSLLFLVTFSFSCLFFLISIIYLSSTLLIIIISLSLSSLFSNIEGVVNMQNMTRWSDDDNRNVYWFCMKNIPTDVKARAWHGSWGALPGGLCHGSSPWRVGPQSDKISF